MYRRRFSIVIAVLIALVASDRAAGQATTRPYLVGGDLSALTHIEQLGGAFRDADGPADPLVIMKQAGWNCARLRLFVNPTKRGFVVNDLPYTLALAKRCKAQGYMILLDLHYSDTWADPGHQTKPKQWENLTFEQLERRVERYTAQVLSAFNRNGVRPDVVQLGNEISNGMLWPEGKLFTGEQAQWEQLARLLKAGVRGVERVAKPGKPPLIMIHLANGGSTQRTAAFFDQMQAHGVRYDMIGLSYYPWWHGTLAQLKDNLNHTAKRFGKPIVVVETAYTWQPHEFNPEKHKNLEATMTWPQTPEGQAQFTRDVAEAVRQTPDGLGAGVVWWHPESIPVEGRGVWMRGRAALFDDKGRALPALYELNHGLKNSTPAPRQPKSAERQ